MEGCCLKSKKVIVFVNGRNQYKIFNIHPKCRKGWNAILDCFSKSLRPYFGAIRILRTANGKKVIDSFNGLKSGGKYVACGLETFKFLNEGYQTHSEERLNQKPIHFYPTEIIEKQDCNKYPSLIETMRKGRTLIYLFVNGKSDLPKKLVLTKTDFDKWDNIIIHIGNILDIPEGIKRLFTVFGQPISSPQEIQHGGYYVAVPFGSYFKQIKYISYKKSKSTRQVDEPLVIKNIENCFTRPHEIREISHPRKKKSIIDFQTKVEHPADKYNFQVANEETLLRNRELYKSIDNMMKRGSKHSIFTQTSAAIFQPRHDDNQDLILFINGQKYYLISEGEFERVRYVLNTQQPLRKEMVDVGSEILKKEVVTPDEDIEVIISTSQEILDDYIADTNMEVVSPEEENVEDSLFPEKKISETDTELEKLDEPFLTWDEIYFSSVRDNQEFRPLSDTPEDNNSEEDIEDTSLLCENSEEQFKSLKKDDFENVKEIKDNHEDWTRFDILEDILNNIDYKKSEKECFKGNVRCECLEDKVNDKCLEENDEDECLEENEDVLYEENENVQYEENEYVQSEENEYLQCEENEYVQYEENENAYYYGNQNQYYEDNEEDYYEENEQEFYLEKKREFQRGIIEDLVLQNVKQDDIVMKDIKEDTMKVSSSQDQCEICEGTILMVETNSEEFSEEICDCDECGNTPETPERMEYKNSSKNLNSSKTQKEFPNIILKRGNAVYNFQSPYNNKNIFEGDVSRNASQKGQKD